MDALPVAFARVLRGMGVEVPVSSVVAYAAALHAVGIDRRAGAYWAGRATLVRIPEDTAAYDAAFASFWLAGGGATADRSVPPPPVVAADEDEAVEGGALASPHELLRHKDFAAFSAAEFDEARRLLAALRVSGAPRRSRRLKPAPTERTGRPDVRRTVRHALKFGGEAVRRPRVEPASQPRRVVLLCDVSGSMEPYARGLIRFLHAAVVGRRRVEAFALGTRVTRITRELSSRDPDAALAAAARRVQDWSGGTRLGPTLRDFNDEWGVRGLARGAVVVILSDGWD
ncbi:MAG: uncharacterized protein QOI20_871, partial [Acidimicrobiaceae bacterium]|nr:uncharacterized protein [Acidimicrobiaceae bacterium]